MPRPPKTKDGRTKTGYPISCAIFVASNCDDAIPNSGALKPCSARIFPKAPRSSAKLIESGDVPRIVTPLAFNPAANPKGV